MSTLEVKIVRVEIKPHPDAERLELAYVNGENGYVSIVGKNQFKSGDLAIYIPVDSVVPSNIESFLKSKNKIDIKNGRIRCIKIRGVFSEGLCLTPSDWLNLDQIKEDADVTDALGIKKYEPPPPPWINGIKSAKGINFNYKNPNFPEYYCVQHLKKHPETLCVGEEVVATVKFHGTNWRAGVIRKPENRRAWWQKLIGYIIPGSNFEFLVGSHDKIKKLTPSAIEYGAKEKDTYWRVAVKYNIEKILNDIAKRKAINRVRPNVVIYGEVIGKIQKGYDYGVQDGDLEIRVFDFMINGSYVDWDEVVGLCKKFNLPIVDSVYRGPWEQKVKELANAIDEYNGKKYVREGLVIRPTKERKDIHVGRVIFKYLSEKFLLDRTNSDYH